MGGAIVGAVAGGAAGYLSDGWKGAVVGTVAGAVTGIVAPMLAAQAGAGAAAALTFAATAGTGAAIAKVITNQWTCKPALDGVGASAAIAFFVPLVISFEAVAIAGAAAGSAAQAEGELAKSALGALSTAWGSAFEKFWEIAQKPSIGTNPKPQK